MDWRADIQRREGEGLEAWSLRRGHVLGQHAHLQLPAAIGGTECRQCITEQEV